MRLGHAAPSEEGMQIVSESYPSRHPQSLYAVTLRNNERDGMSRIYHDRHRSLADDAAFHGRFSSEGFTVADRSVFYGSRNMFDQHRDMRLDIDNMTYEELLALGERIGSVNTRLPEDSISKCLAETIYHSSDQIQYKSSCDMHGLRSGAMPASEQGDAQSCSEVGAIAESRCELVEANQR
ncbi:E3 ubiquitin-protein ligase MBR1-like [Hibiscus syriacus]|uniref:E3 ubiquitin-protein ligase MBR1-like n=1 Tax=Hibiscus syriacus TaxID=106335 RepID=UPI0019229E68|nr:E3 ubiquitin-protein ligase MBR1-like [Hibiscus syriacus]